MDDASPSQKDTRKRQPVGPVVATILVVLIFILGGLYFFVTQAARMRAEHNAAQFNS